MNVYEAQRVIVISDAHGHVHLVENALDDAGFDAARDGLIYAGDLVDGGSTPEQSQACIELLKHHGAQFLWGNHDVAVLLEYPIDYQQEDSIPRFKQAFRDEFLNQDPLRWRLVVRVQGVFVSHAGISTDYLNDYLYADKSRRVDDPDGFVARLNDMFDVAVQRQFDTGRRDKLSRILGRRSPHRFRAFDEDMGPRRELGEATQVAGHSAPETFARRRSRQRLAGVGLHVVDPSSVRRKDKCAFRYGLIQDGRVTLAERPGGVLGRSSAEDEE